MKRRIYFIFALCSLVMSVWAEQGPRVYSHRGYEYGELRLSTFKEAYEKGLRSFEMDVRFCRDEVLVVMHDATVDRTTTSKGFVHDLTLKEYKALCIRVPNTPPPVAPWNPSKGPAPIYRVTDEHPPTYQEVLDFFADKPDAFLQIELLQNNPGSFYTEERMIRFADKIVAQTKAALQPGHYMFTSFWRPMLKIMQTRHPEMPTMLSFPHTIKSAALEQIEEALSFGCTGVSVPYWSVSQAFVDCAHQKGLHVSTWLVQDKVCYADMTKLKVDSVVSGYPTKLLNK